MAGIGSLHRVKTSDFRHRVTISQPVETQDATGQPVVSWEKIHVDVPAKYRQLSGAEAMAGRELETREVGVFVVRYIRDLTTKMKIVHNQVSYGITRINPVDGLEVFQEVFVATS
jgi:SPP1 family predicted phage head-tail adaptor